VELVAEAGTVGGRFRCSGSKGLCVVCALGFIAADLTVPTCGMLPQARKPLDTIEWKDV
jgi:hypothetical protein